MDEIKQKRRTTSTLLAQAPRPGTYRLIQEEAGELQNKQASLSRQIITLPIPAIVVEVIYEPQGLSNPITMGIKTSKA